MKHGLSNDEKHTNTQTNKQTQKQNKKVQRGEINYNLNYGGKYIRFHKPTANSHRHLNVYFNE